MQYCFDLTRLPSVSVAGRCSYRAGWHRSAKPRSHMILFMKKGEFVFRLNEQTVTLHDGELLIFPAGTPYRVTAKEDCDYLYLHFFPDEPLTDMADQGPSTLILPQKMSFADRLDQQEKIIRAIEEIASILHESHPYAGMMLSAELSRFLVFVAMCHAEQIAPQSPLAFRRMQSYIQEHVNEAVTLSALAEVSGLSRQYVMRMFKTHTGQTATQYIHAVKLAHAQKLLRENDSSLEEVSEQIGLCGAHYLCRLFKQHYGLTPGEYRERFRREL